MFKRLKRIFNRDNMECPRYSRIIIETVGSCNLTCRMCPTTHYGPSHKGIMDDQLFYKALEYVRPDMQVILTGWGEPLIDPNLEQRISSCKKKGATVYIATNSTLLHRQRAESLLDSGLDGLSISLDAGSEATYRSIRGGDFNSVTENIKNLSVIRSQGRPDFWIDMSFVTMQQNIKDLPKFIQLGADLGVNSVTITPKYLSFSRKDHEEHFVPVEIILAEIEQIEKKPPNDSIEIRTYALRHFPEKDCLAEAVRTAFISFKGEISACCNLGHPAPRYIPETQETITPYVTYGSLVKEDLDSIWCQERFFSLRNALEQGAVPSPCRGCFLAPVKGRD